jgi:hypothetical protein
VGRPALAATRYREVIVPGTFIGAVLAGVKYIVPLLVQVGLSASWATLVAISGGGFIAALLLWGSFRVVVRRSRLLRPERFDLRVRRRDDLLGRDNDVEDLRV